MQQALGVVRASGLSAVLPDGSRRSGIGRRARLNFSARSTLRVRAAGGGAVSDVEKSSAGVAASRYGVRLVGTSPRASLPLSRPRHPSIPGPMRRSDRPGASPPPEARGKVRMTRVCNWRCYRCAFTRRGLLPIQPKDLDRQSTGLHATVNYGRARRAW
jgi:hypothetical protein